MSNFQFISDTEKEIARGQLIFSQFETLTNVLLNESLDMHQEFKVKAEFVNEQFMKNVRNEKEIENILNMSLRVQQEFYPIEIELLTLEKLLQQLDYFAKNLEQTNRFWADSRCVSSRCFKTQRHEFLEMLQNTNRKIEEWPQLSTTIQDFYTLGSLKNPYLHVRCCFVLSFIFYLCFYSKIISIHVCMYIHMYRRMYVCTYMQMHINTHEYTSYFCR